MKNKFKIYIFFLLFGCINTTSIVFANDFIFDSAQINVSENGNLINASNGKAKTLDGTVEVIAKNFIYVKDEAKLTATGEVILKDLINKITIKSEVLILNTNSNIIKSNTDSVIEDSSGNIIFTKKFLFTQYDRLIKIDNAKIIDIKKNNYTISQAYIDLNSNKLIGKDVSIDFNNLYFEKDNEPRVKGNTISSIQNQTTITKGVFTTCKKNDDCPPWQISAKEIRHDKEKKMIYYKDAWLKIYDKPIFYFPKFFHPDPTVKRQSGFLMPSFMASSSLGGSLNVPYYHVLSDNKDFTVKPRLYSNDKLLLQTELRHEGKESSNVYDFSFVHEKNSPTKSHFFAKNKTNLNIFDTTETEINYQVQQVSNDTYLKTYKLDSPLIENESLLTSSINLNTYNEDLSFDASFKVFEDLNKTTSDRYEFIYPSYELTKKFDEGFSSNGQLTLNTSGFAKNYDTNIFEKVNINDFIFNTNPKISSNGLKNDINFLIKNVNSDAQRSKSYKNRSSHTLASLMQYNVSYPLIKKSNGGTKKINPKLALKFSPNNTKNIKDKERRMDINNIYSLNRISGNDTVEGGASLTYGTEFVKTNNKNRDIFQTNFANVLRLKENKNLPNQNGLNDKISDIIGNFEYDPNDKFNLNYNFALDNNLNDYNYQQINTEFKINNFVTSFEYLNENKTSEGKSYLTNKTSYLVNSSSNFSFERRENKKTNMTEFYNLIYQYRNDCLIAAVEYNKDYYSDRDLEPEENVFFKLTITPFGETSSPNLLSK